eukprot:CAMPEP_0185809070 /NCGR_PEP_ID=MMETSP1322-20130828/5985_1 /TAXON_ID=265543 /ORGANISM="Minutocellus polymorphus, Strain RCC2270" /LENGTH=41 /DNA_ID= /DNA_START= /DNA_END= /DNA_ORIENTATION=
MAAQALEDAALACISRIWRQHSTEECDQRVVRLSDLFGPSN